MKTSHLFALAGGILCAAVAVTDVMAGNNYSTNRKIMTGAQCQPSNGDEWSDFIINPEGLRNINEIATPTKAATRYVSCALVFDGDTALNQSDFDATTAAGGMIVEIGLDYRAVPASRSPITNCTLIRYDSDGTRATAAFPAVQAVGGTTAVQVTSTDSMILDGLNPINPDTVSLNCRLPSQVRLTYLKTYERENTGGYYYTP